MIISQPRYRYPGFRALIVLAALIFISLPAMSWASVVTYTHTVRQPFNGSQSPDEARIAAIAKAKREVLEKAGTYLDSIKIVRDRQLVQNQITALSAAVLQAEIISQKNYVEGETFGIEIEAKVSVDTATLNDRINNFLKDQSALARAERLEQREKELLAKVKELEERSVPLDLAKKNRHDIERQKGKLSKEFAEVNKKLTAVEANRRALALWDGMKFADAGKAIEYLNEAVRMDDHFAEAFNNRGIAYADMKQWTQSIKDYDRAIKLEPQFSDAFNNRGAAYAHLGETQKAIQNFDQAIKFHSGFSRAYYNRGTVYINQGRVREAIEDFSRAIEQGSGDAAVYYNRGNIYAAQGEFLNAIKDYDQAIKMDSTKAAFYFNRGVGYTNLGQFQLACRDLDKAIQLDPKDISVLTSRGIVLFKSELYQQAIKDFDQVIYFHAKEAKAYKYRGLCYLMLKEEKLFCADLESACKFGDCESLEKVKDEGFCK